MADHPAVNDGDQADPHQAGLVEVTPELDDLVAPSRPLGTEGGPDHLLDAWSVTGSRGPDGDGGIHG